MLRRLLSLLVVVLAGLVVYLGVTVVQIWLTSRRDQARPAQAIVVMGSAEYDGRPSPDLQARLDQVVALWRRHLAPMVVVTGGKEPGDVYTESQVSATYLERHGVPASEVAQVDGRNSWQSLSAAAALLHGRHLDKVLLVSDPYHSARILAIGSELGLQGYASPTRTSPIRGTAVIPYYAKETVAVALGRVIGFGRVSQLHAQLGLMARHGARPVAANLAGARSGVV